MDFFKNEESLREIMVRKNWLMSFLVLSIFNLFFAVFEVIHEYHDRRDFWFGLFEIVLCMPWCLITYHCAYKKKGTAWLTWTMITIPLMLILGLPKLIMIGILAGSNIFLWLMFLFFIGITINFWINCFRLHQINTFRREVRKFKDSVICQECILKMENTQNLDELNCALGYLIGKWPQWERQISNLYHLRKEWLLQSLITSG